MDEVTGKVTIAPTVLTTIVRQTTLDQAGVRRLAAAPPNVRNRLAGGVVENGIAVLVTDAGVQVEIHIVADSDTNMLKLGTALQNDITRALEEMVGMNVAAVDVFIDDVAMPAEQHE
jgi:uncharacterized alkaline shock family protein YloU